MSRSSTLAFACVLFLSAEAQHINNVTISPQSPTECTLISFTITGALPQSGQLQNFVPSVGPNTITVDLNAAGGTSGNANFNQTIPGLGPFSPGSYTLTVHLVYNGNVADTWTGPLVVGPGVNADPGEYAETSVCNSAPSFQLITVLGGTPDAGGEWLDPLGQPVNNGQFHPGISPEGYYTYLFDLQPPCHDTDQQVLIVYTQSNSPGLPGTVQVCATGGAAVDLFSHLGGTPDAGGTWTHNGTAFSGTFHPGVDACGPYVYTVPGVPPCTAASATVTVQCVQPPNAGTDGSVILCENDTSEVLNNYITGEPNTGFWLDPGGFSLGPYNVAVNCSVVGAGVYSYVVQSQFCPSDTSHVTVTLQPLPCTPGFQEFPGNVARLDLLPNPARDQVTVELELGKPSNGATLDVLDVNGAVVRHMPLTINGTFLRRTLDLADLPRGAYLVRVSSAEGSAVRRLMLH